MTMIAPRPAAFICGAAQRARCSKAMTLTWKLAFEHRRVDVQEVAEGAADGVVHHDAASAGFGFDARQRGVQRIGLGHIARHRERIRVFLRQGLQPLGIAGQHGHAVAALMKAAHQRGPGAGAHAGDDGQRFHAEATRTISSSTSRSRSLPNHS